MNTGNGKGEEKVNYNKDIFNEVLKDATLSTVDFNEPIKYDDEIIKYGEQYINALLGETMLIMQCGGDAEEYYYMIATHALYAAFCIANWERIGKNKEESLESVVSMDSILLMRINWKEVDTDNVDWYASTVYNMATMDLRGKFDQDLIIENTIDNTNEFVLGLLMGFFVIGYNLISEYFDEE